MINEPKEHDQFGFERWVYKEALELVSGLEPIPSAALALVHAYVEYGESLEYWGDDLDYRESYLELKNEFIDLFHTEAGHGLAYKSIRNFLDGKD